LDLKEDTAERDVDAKQTRIHIKVICDKILQMDSGLKPLAATIHSGRCVGRKTAAAAAPFPARTL
jgi:hypothetical protein